ncbi:MAG: bifunctional folylpolyglutamate synthase/dihydrofolate synthase [Lachnospiraceae bacterium]|nr:bifunctional folylpolyglutamate synthase/dihydrofolate synthase [Lachnospiraceae bacterium]
MSTYADAVSYIEQIQKYMPRPGIENSSRLLELLGHPEETLSIIHVAGTNGKGSVCCFLADMLISQGFQTGLFISPHLVDIRERIQLNRELISREAFAAAFDEVQTAVAELTATDYPGVTYFDYLFAMAMCYYRKAGADYVVMETGLGGRFDSTNAVPHPILTIITSISPDHTEILGTTLAEIAYQKAGILKPGIPLIYCADQPEVITVIEQEAAKVGCHCIGISQSDCTLLSLAPGRMTYRFQPETAAAIELTVAANALYQMENSAIAYTAALLLMLQRSDTFELSSLSAAGLLDRTASHSALTTGLQSALAHSHWEGRLEQVAPNVFIDGAHNADGIDMLLASFRLLKEAKYVCAATTHAPCPSNSSDTLAPSATLLFTAVKEKDTDEMIRKICESGLFDRYLLTTIAGPRAIAPDALAAQFRKYTDAPITEWADPMTAFQTALAERQPVELLLVAGSLYLVGDIKAYLQKKMEEE